MKLFYLVVSAIDGASAYFSYQQGDILWTTILCVLSLLCFLFGMSGTEEENEQV